MVIGFRRSLALLVAGTLAPILAFSAIAVYWYDREQSAATEQAVLDATRVLVVALDNHFEATITALRVLGTSEQLDRGDLRGFHDACRRALEARGEWRTISLFDAAGRRLFITSEPFGTPLAGPPPVMTEPFRRLVEARSPNVSDLFQSPLTQRLAVSVGVPILRESAVRWVISAGMSPDALGALLASERVLPDWTGALLDRRYVMAAHSRERRLVGEAVSAPFAKVAAGSFEGTYRGQSAVLTAFSRSRRFGWTASISVPAPGGIVRQPVQAILVVGAGLLLAGVAVAVWAGRRISRPMEALAMTARRIGRGETVDPVPSRIAEVAALSTALVSAARDRVQAQSELAKYAERLRVLHEIDRSMIAAEAPVEIAEAALRPLRDLLGVPRAIVNLFDLEAGEVEWLAAIGRRRVRLGPGVRYPLKLAGDVEALRRGEMQVIDVDALPDSPEAKALLASGVHVYMVAPMLVRGELIGSLSFGGARGQFSDEQIAIAREAAAQLAIAISQAHLHERVKRQAEELETRVQQRTAELAAATAEADRANHAKSEFLSRMSHELRTPLNAILGFGQLLQMRGDELGDRESVEQILKGGRHLLDLINEVLDISRIESGRLPLSPEPVEVGEAVRRVVDLARPLAAERRITLEVAGEVLHERYVLADSQRLQQVLLNLVSNGIKYNREGGRVVVTCHEAGAGRLRLTVADTGTGIPPEARSRLFTPFDRLGAEAGSVEGTGLGLALSKRLVEAMSGSIGLDSAEGGGSVFWIELAETAAPDVRAGLGVAGAPPPPSATRRGVILYIEDNLSNLRLVERVLSEQPAIRFIPAMQGRLGLALAREHRPDLVLLDLHLPDVSGEDVLRELKSDPTLGRTPVIVLSADATPGQVRRLLAAGAHAYLTKPLDVRQLLTHIDAALPAA